ncbi:unnamed protein product [Brassicogethes aeneus]|uniref:Transcriptional coactivator p15 (PC4) C-terminal domain-containing protein n=1 Tax=Brassicogethes aeneus TaxID=1431903 RepID=A0A9P0FQF5_BRAAE|nr:unnamed protein product [Brassicogethes aeneus]
MPKTKKEETSDSDSGPDDRAPVKKAKTKGSSDSGSESDKAPVKKSKTKEKSSSKPKPKENDDNSWTIGKNRHVKLTEFKGKWYVDIREFYIDASGEAKPGRKGIMLTMEQWQKFKGCLDEVDDAIKQNV